MRGNGAVYPGQTLGIVGGGQLGRMAVVEARRAGYRVAVYTDEPNGSPAGQLADTEINASYFDEEARGLFLKEVDVVTVEFENIPAASLAFLAERVSRRFWMRLRAGRGCNHRGRRCRRVRTGSGRSCF